MWVLASVCLKWDLPSDVGQEVHKVCLAYTVIGLRLVSCQGMLHNI